MFGFTPATLRDLATEMGAPADEPMRWVGGELLAGTAADLRALVAACDALEEEIAAHGAAFTTEEQAVTLAGRLGRVELHDLSPVAWRLWTGPRHHAPVPDDPGALGLWHLPAEKGLGFRRTAGELLAGRPGPFARDLRDRERLMRRFNVAGTGLARRVRDDAWIASQRLRDRAAAARAARRAGDTLRP
jgi:hypothetical protein